MKAPNWATCTEKELWHYVAYHLSLAGVSSVLVGGAVVSVYSAGLYRSGDIDLVAEESVKKISIILEALDFRRIHRHFQHPLCSHIFVEIVSGPIAIGDDYKIVPDTVAVSGECLRILSPTDCIKDRLASYIYFGARECLDQAILVGRAQPYREPEIERLCRHEKSDAVFREFKSGVDAALS